MFLRKAYGHHRSLINNDHENDDFQRQRDFAKRQLSDFSGMLRGVPVTPNQTTSTYSQQPGLFQQALGAGLSGLGLYKGFGGG